MNQYQKINEDQISSYNYEKENDLTHRKQKNKSVNKQDKNKKLNTNYEIK